MTITREECNAMIDRAISRLKERHDYGLLCGWGEALRVELLREFCQPPKLEWEADGGSKSRCHTWKSKCGRYEIGVSEVGCFYVLAKDQQVPCWFSNIAPSKYIYSLAEAQAAAQRHSEEAASE